MEGIDYSQARFWMDALQLAGLVALGVYTHLTQRSKANSQAITNLSEQSRAQLETVSRRVGDIERRTDVMENQLRNAPTHNDLAVTHKRMSRVSEQLENLDGRFTSVDHQLKVISEYLLNDKRGGNR
ncbi:hypothetical protein HOP54_02340 [Halomonas daqingensis]|uniref:hypothetical protein n=1 Tax=Billgrantia desiderata TaxID=52021 RepID=UPI001F24257D|nr:hypothetical protein [Halomonas desiderata]MCE8027528.1 hypothetical protein [Halomonas desiderata]